MKFNSDKTLIIYLSRTGNTEAFAKLIQREVGGTLEELISAPKYKKNFGDLLTKIIDENKNNEEHGIKPIKVNLEDYDTVFVGSPTWNNELPPPAKTFLKKYDLSDKTIIPFNTNAGEGIGTCLNELREIYPKAKILSGYSIEGGIELDGIKKAIESEHKTEIEEAVEEWLAGLK
ncbi:MAG: flavodoxin [Micrococcaceae bacterium]